MKKLFIISLFIVFILSSCSTQNETKTTNINFLESKISVAPIEEKKAEKIEIVLVHGTFRCFSCNAMEELVKKTLVEKFRNETDSGKITFTAINGEDPENIEMVRKLGATGLSIFINGIVEGKDNIVEEKNLWRYIQNEEQFKSYLTQKLNSL